MTLDPQILLYALLGGIIPALLWLWFWLKEDKRKPEPTGLIMLSFISGMVAVAIVLPLEKFAFNLLEEGTPLIVVWAAIEEIIKYSTISFVAFHSRYFDEPVDAMIYMITVALGFAALENSLFLLGPLTSGEFTASFITGNLRYMGATLLHVAASGIVGVFIGFSFYKGKILKTVSVVLGLILAIYLHSIFNLSIINSTGSSTFTTFWYLWLVIIVLIFFFERVKRVKKIRE